jgi:hypothetical protein
MYSSVPVSTLAALPTAGGMAFYIAGANTGGVERVEMRGTTVLSDTLIPTPNSPRTCAANWVTGQVVCPSFTVPNPPQVYLLSGKQLTATLTDGATGDVTTSGISDQSGGVVIDASRNLAVLSVGLNLGSIAATGEGGGYQLLDLNTNTFSTPVPVGTNPILPAKGDMATSENMALDPVRQLILSANEQGDYQIGQYSSVSSPLALYDNVHMKVDLSPNDGAFFDGTAVDVTTGIALASDEYQDSTNEPFLVVVDTKQKSLTAGSPNGTWTAPFSVQHFNELPPALLQAMMTVVPGTHLALLTSELASQNETAVTVVRLPSYAGCGTPAVVDWVSIIQNVSSPVVPYFQADGPHGLSGYVDPNTGRAMVALRAASLTEALVLADLEAILAAPRSAAHVLDPTYDLYGSGALLAVNRTSACPGANLNGDPNNCGTCGHVCAGGANAIPACNGGACTYTCDTGFADCNGLAADGCEVNLESDPGHCGSCTTSCAVTNGARACVEGACGSIVCNAGFANCDGQTFNGCETTGHCTAPTVTLTAPPTTVAVGTTIDLAATAQPGSSLPLTYAWTELSGPANGMTFGSPAALTTTAEFLLPGTYVIQLEATDGVTTSTAQATVQAELVNHAPVVNAGAPQAITAPTMTAALQGSVTDDALPSGATLASTWSLVSGPAAVTIATPKQTGLAEPGPVSIGTQVTFAFPGVYTFELDVSDSDLVGSAQTTVTVNAPATVTGVAPVVSFPSGLDGQTLTQPTPITASVSDGSWVLEYRLGGRDDVTTAYSVLASGTGARTNAVLGTFDTTLLLNGIYTLRLSSESTAGTTSVSVAVAVDGRMKVGNFTLAFTDLDVAVAGLPLQLVRTYDSRDKRKGDFGVGWNLAVKDVRVEKAGKTGAYWNTYVDSSGFFTQICLTPTQSAAITITFPSGREYRFTPAQLCTPLEIPDPSNLKPGFRVRRGSDAAARSTPRTHHAGI